MDELRTAAPRTETAAQAPEKHDFRQIQLDPATQAVRLPRGMQVDLGGIAKGWIAEQAAWQLAEISSVCAVSAGGDMFLIGQPAGETGWEIGLENPLDPDQDLEQLTVMPGAVATSSITKRKWQHNGQSQHHLIDPHSGKPAQTEWLSVTVWAERSAEAEVYPKVLLISGPQAAGGLFEKRTSAAYLAVDKHGRLYGSSNHHEVFHV